MDEALPKRKKRLSGRLIAVIALGIALVGSAWFAFRPRDELAFVGNASDTLRVIPRTRIASRPWINFSIGSWKMVYPKPHVVPPEFGQVPGLSGVLISEAATSPWEGASWMGTATWVVDGVPIPAGPGFLGSNVNPGKADVWACPYVFGDVAREVVLKPSSLEEDGIRLRLPPNHQAAPATESHEVKGDGWTVHLKPKPWISPSFPLRFEVTVDGGEKNEAFLLAFTEALDGAANLVVRPGEPAELSFQNWEATWGVLMQIQKVTVVPLRIAVTRTALTGNLDVLKFSLDDFILAQATIDKSRLVVEEESSFGLAGYAAVQIDEYWPSGEFEVRHTYGRRTSDRGAQWFAKFKDGDMVDAIGYKGALPFTQTDFLMKLPDPRKIVGTRAYAQDGPR